MQFFRKTAFASATLSAQTADPFRNTPAVQFGCQTAKTQPCIQLQVPLQLHSLWLRLQGTPAEGKSGPARSQQSGGGEQECHQPPCHASKRSQENQVGQLVGIYDLFAHQ